MKRYTVRHVMYPEKFEHESVRMYLHWPYMKIIVLQKQKIKKMGLLILLNIESSAFPPNVVHEIQTPRVQVKTSPSQNAPKIKIVPVKTSLIYYW